MVHNTVLGHRDGKAKPDVGYVSVGIRVKRAHGLPRFGFSDVIYGLP
jgi:hypothetical protein